MTGANQSGPSTRCVHAGTRPDSHMGGVVTPIFPSTAHRYPGPSGENPYPRYFNVANITSVSEKIAALESGEAGMVFGSGMAAISTALFSLLRAGDHVLFHQDLYGGTLHLATQVLPRFGIEVSFCDLGSPGLDRHTKDNTRVIYAETPTNPLLRITDLAAVAAFAQPRRILTMVDNTFASPINQRPLELGFDLVLHSGTKYLNGHSDVCCGAVVGNKELVERVRSTGIDHGGVLDPRACWLLERGLKTLALRVHRQNENAQRVAEYLAQHPRVQRVMYPGLLAHPGHEIARRQMTGFGGMLSFELNGTAADAQQFAKALRLFTVALSLGGVESLICFPSQTSHLHVAPEERRRMGISEGLMRMSVGIEDASDLIADLENALA